MNINVNNRQNFTAVIPIKVKIDGKVAANEENIKRGIRLASKVFNGPIQGLSIEEKNIARTLSQIDKSYKFTNAWAEKVYLVRNLVDKTTAYLFTGIHAEKLGQLGKKIGPAKSNAIARFGNSKSFESSKLANNYFDEARKMIDNPNARLKYDNKDVGMIIDTKSNGKYGKSTFKMFLDKVSYGYINPQ